MLVSLHHRHTLTPATGWPTVSGEVGQYGSREVHFFGPFPLVYIPTVGDRRRSSPKGL